MPQRFIRIFQYKIDSIFMLILAKYFFFLRRNDRREESLYAKVSDALEFLRYFTIPNLTNSLPCWNDWMFAQCVHHFVNMLPTLTT